MKKHRLLVSALLGAVLSISAVEPPLADVDVVVAGGSLAGVAAAVAAREAGARVFVVAPRPYLGEDVAGKLRLAKEPDDDLSHPLMKALYAVRGKPAHAFGDVTPLQVKRVCDEALLKAKIPFQNFFR